MLILSTHCGLGSFDPFGRGNDEAFAFGERSTAQNLQANDAIKLAVGKNSFSHDDVSSFVYFIHYDVFDGFSFNKGP